MKKLLSIFIIISLFQICEGQNTKSIESDTSIIYKSHQEEMKKIGLKDLTQTKDTLHFRFSSEIQAIDIWSNYYQTFHGSIANFTKEYDPDRYKRKRVKPEKFYSEINNIDTSLARVIYNLFMADSIYSIPPQDSIPNWSYGFDGVIYFVEYSTPEHYSFKYYWSPGLFDAIEEAQTIFKFTENLEKLLNLERSFVEFLDILPHGSYHGTGYIIIMTLKKKHRK